MSLARATAIATAGLSAQRTRMEVVAANLANARTTRTPEGGPYRRQTPVFTAAPTGPGFGDELGRVLRSVRVERIDRDPSPPVMRYEPGHPDADDAGYVAYPNVDPVKEMVDLMAAARSYESNVTLVKSIQEMKRSALSILS